MRSRSFIVCALLVTGVVAGLLSGWASERPDGLEHVAATHDFADTARDSPTADSPLADYAVAGLDQTRLSGGLAGLVGCVVTLSAATAALRLRGRNMPAQR